MERTGEPGGDKNDAAQGADVLVYLGEQDKGQGGPKKAEDKKPDLHSGFLGVGQITQGGFPAGVIAFFRRGALGPFRRRVLQ